MGVPSNYISPFVGVEIDSSRAFQGPSTLRYQALLFGQKTDGTLATDTITRVFGADEVGVLAGLGSQVHQMAKKYFANNMTTDTYICLLDDAGGASKAVNTYTITGDATIAGEIQIYIDGRRISTAVAVGDSANTIAANLAAAIQLVQSELSVVATVATNVITLTAKNAGTVGNSLDVRETYNDADVIPEGVNVSITQTTPGAVDPDISTVIAAMGDQWFNVITSPYSDTTSLGLMETELDSRFGVERQIDGMYYIAKKDTVNNMISFATAAGRNNKSVILVDCEKYPNAPYEIAAAIAGQTAASAQDDPAVPLHRLDLVGILAPLVPDRRILQELNTLALNGVATIKTSPNGVQTYNTVTMYLKNSSGAPDIAYQFQNTLFILMLLRYQFRVRIETKYARSKLADSVERLRPGQSVITPSVGKAEAVALASEWVELGYVEDLDQFKADVICQRSTTNPNRLEWILPPDLINQFIVGSADLQFILDQ